MFDVFDNKRLFYYHCHSRNKLYNIVMIILYIDYTLYILKKTMIGLTKKYGKYKVLKEIVFDFDKSR